MNLLLDTHTFLFWIDGSARLGRRARRTIEDPDNVCFVSLATAWELAIKCSIGKLTLAAPLGRFFAHHVSANAFTTLAIDLAHIARVERLPAHHGDPFDRLLIAQALVEALPIVSADPVFSKYGLRRLW